MTLIHNLCILIVRFLQKKTNTNIDGNLRIKVNYKSDARRLNQDNAGLSKSTCYSMAKNFT